MNVPNTVIKLYPLDPKNCKLQEVGFVEIKTVSDRHYNECIRLLRQINAEILSLNLANLSIFADLLKLNTEQKQHVYIMPGSITLYKALEQGEWTGVSSPTCPLVQKQRRG